MEVVEDGRDVTLIEILRAGEDTTDPTHPWLRRIDEFATRWGDRLNPILVKETRQALKSRQFVTTFSLLLVASLAWTVIGTLQGMPAIYYTPSAGRMLIGYYLLLAVPMLLIVPLAAYRSLESEVDEGTLDLLSVTSLSPRQIITGKLASAALQMMLYLVVLFPSVAFAYTLRGVDLPTLALLMAMLIAAGLALTMVALFFAPVSVGKTGQVASLLVVTAVLVWSEFLVGPVAFELIRNGNPLSLANTLVIAISVLAFGISFCVLLLITTAARLTPESENRSTGIRVACLAHLLVVFAVCGFATRWFANFLDPQNLVAIPLGLSVYLVAFWTLVGSMACAESAVMTPRIRRELPGTFFGRLFFSWLTPGPATGLVFATVTLAITLAGAHRMLSWVSLPANLSALDLESHRTISLLVVAYLTIGFLGVRVIIAFLRTRNPVTVRVGLAALAVTLMLMTVAPYAIGSYLNDYRPFNYSAWQATNWLWTIRLAAEQQLDNSIVYLVVGVATTAFLVHLLLLGQRVLPQRLATPERVEQEYRRLAGLEAATAQPIDPLGLVGEPRDA